MSLESMATDLITRTQGALDVIGEEGAAEMRRFLPQGDDSGTDTERLKNSISFATARAVDRGRGSNLKEGDLPEKPTDPLTVHIGTGVPYAKYVNYGSLPMPAGVGSAEPGEGTFREKILEWAIRKWGDSEETKDRADGIARAIAHDGVGAIPFFEPSFVGIRMIVRKGVQTLSRELVKGITPGITIVFPDGSIQSGTAHGRGGAKRLVPRKTM